MEDSLSRKPKKLEEGRTAKTGAKNQLWVIRKAFRTAEAEILNSEWTLAARKSLPRAPNGPPGESKMSPGTPPDAHPEHVKAPSAASEPLAGAPCQKTSIFLRETIDSRRRVGPSRPRISPLLEHLGMPSPLSPNLFFRTCLFELCFFRTSPLTPTPRPSRGRRTEWACAHCRRPRRTELFAAGVTARLN